MRYSEYFEQVGECVQDADAAAAEKLLREVEAYSLSSVVTHSVL